ncbi:triose-phosphate isomerase [Ahniella affigens]|uniref:Triosephosphate isomerase n=1 Tax=Ahniella affigens TaxID=2021234 RepID=A0A2P1PR64_9GAMM|nr:triose-phosphate isomerase [Ahniella affigens]AVP97322.1 triose-phosphate isomerase [Ahniella affigens]
MRRKLVAGNWKMFGSLARNQALVTDVLAGLPQGNCEVAVCPPYVYLAQVAQLTAGSRVQLGAQDLSPKAEGAYTGDVAGPMLKELGATLVLVGHSERRHGHGENDSQVAEKFVAAQAHGLLPVLCLGETLAEREAGETELVLARQLDAVTQRAGVAALANAVLAYEPVWAIGTGKTASPEQAEAAHAFLRSRIAKQDAMIADSLRILYGGSVKAGNAEAIFAKPNVDGGLIGGASLVVQEFLSIIAAAR